MLCAARDVDTGFVKPPRPALETTRLRLRSSSAHAVHRPPLFIGRNSRPEKPRGVPIPAADSSHDDRFTEAVAHAGDLLVLRRASSDCPRGELAALGLVTLQVHSLEAPGPCTASIVGYEFAWLTGSTRSVTVTLVGSEGSRAVVTIGAVGVSP